MIIISTHFVIAVLIIIIIIAIIINVLMLRVWADSIYIYIYYIFRARRTWKRCVRVVKQNANRDDINASFVCFPRVYVSIHIR